MDLVTVGLLVDPGLPEKIARSIPDQLSRTLTQEFDDGVRWEVEISQETLPLTADGAIPLLDHADRLLETHDWDYVIYLTDLPCSHDDTPMSSQVSTSVGAALISLPTLGSIRVRVKVCRLVGALIHSLRTEDEGAPSSTAIRRALGRLAFISVVVVSALTVWLVVHNGLWNRLRTTDTPRQALRDNVSTLVTVGLSIGLMYVLLWLLLFLLALVTVTPDVDAIVRVTAGACSDRSGPAGSRGRYRWAGWHRRGRSPRTPVVVGTRRREP